MSFRDEAVYLDDFENMDPYEFAAEILLNAMDKAAGEHWSNFEEALAYINFDDKFPSLNHKKCKTYDEEREIMMHYLLYMNTIANGFIYCSKIWQRFFGVWIKRVQQMINNDEFLPRESLINLFSKPNMQFLTFNYTKTLQKLYGAPKVIHIHNRVGQELIFGHEKGNVIGAYKHADPLKRSNVTISSLDDMILSFKKDTDTPLKKYKDFFKRLDNAIDEVYSYGFSYGKVDGVYIKKIIERISPNAIWYFTKFESSDSQAIRIKKIKLRRYGFKGRFGIYEG